MLFRSLFLPSTLILALWGMVGLFLYDAVIKTCGTDILEQIMNYFLKIPTIPVNLSTIFGFFGIAIFVTVILQTFLIYIVNFEISKPFKIAFAKLKAKLTKTEIVIKEESTEKIKIKVDLLSCIFSSIVIFLLIIAFVFISILLSKSLAKELLPKILE